MEGDPGIAQGKGNQEPLVRLKVGDAGENPE